MKKFTLGLCLLALSSLGFGSTLVSTQGIFSDPNQVFEQSFAYDPAIHGGILTIQSYGYGGSSNAPGGTNAAGTVILPGGFDPIVGLFAGGAGGGGARLAFNDDGTCAPGFGATDAGICFDPTIVIAGLAAGTYTISLSVFPNFPPTTETGAYPGGPADFGTGANQVPRSNAFAVDVVATPEPLTFGMIGAGLLVLGLQHRRRFRS
ncbi:MAG: DVUA0089 family protein [Acidobacteriia bacterium]|nr:DVUA0089 family protein [Terriglobia bacterium]